MISGTELARLEPVLAARLVVNPKADTQNAWDVLLSAFSIDKALALVLAQPGGAEALASIDMAPSDLCDATVTINGNRAKVTGYLHDFAVVTDLTTRMSCEFAWSTVQRIVIKGGRFES